MNHFPSYYHIFNRGVEKRKIFSDFKDYKRFVISLKQFNNFNRLKLRDKSGISPPISSTGVFTPVEPVEEVDDDKLVEIVAYCLNPNHYHLLLKEITENGVSKFIQKLITGYTGYFNKKNERTGALFQGKHKKLEITSNAQLLYLSAYINANHYVHKIKDFEDWEFSSLWDYIGKRDGRLCFKDDILGQFNGNKKDYRDFCKRTCDDIKGRRDFEKFLLE